MRRLSIEPIIVERLELSCQPFLLFAAAVEQCIGADHIVPWQHTGLARISRARPELTPGTWRPQFALFTDGPSYLQSQMLWFLSSFGPNAAAVSARIDRHPIMNNQFTDRSLPVGA
jgi:hypothetical protein